MGRPSGFMKPCKFYSQGSCRNGTNCRFSHESSSGNKSSSGFQSQPLTPFGIPGDSSNSGPQGVAMTESGRALAIEELKVPPIWSLSGFAVAKGLPSVVTGDVSPEEARWEAYQELKTLGNCMQSAQKLQALATEQQTQRHRVVALLENYQSALRLFAGDSLLGAAGSTGQGSTGNPFGGGAKASPFTATPPASPFGATTATNPFSGGTASSGSSFGAAGSTNAAFNAFRTSSTTLGTLGGSGFGISAAVNPFGGGPAPTATLFGKAATPATSPFGAMSTTTLGGTAVPSTTFGSTSTSFKGGTNSASVFGSGTSRSGVIEGEPVAPPFGKGTASAPFGTASTTTPFNVTSSSMATTLGGSSSGFGTSTTPFGASTLSSTASSSYAPSSSPFGAQTALPSTVSAFNGLPELTSVPTIASSPPSALEVASVSPDLRDDAWNAEQFQRAEFTFGRVPTVPPPLQFC